MLSFSQTNSPLIALIVAWTALTGFMAADGLAQQPIQLPGKGPAYTGSPVNDTSFGIVGEFVGKLIADSSKPTMLGLQVRKAVGKDRFTAIAYRGGLPGQPQCDLKPIEMEGRELGGLLVLSGGPWAMLVNKEVCRVVDRSGNTIAELKKIKRSSPTMHSPAPQGATILFDGTGTSQFSNANMSTEGWLKEGALVKPLFQDYNLHAEFRLPYMPEAEGQKRGNSGMYLQCRYECQVLDSFATIPVASGCGAIYRFKKPDLNMCLPPLSWQTYDIKFTSPRWDSDGNKIRNASISSWLNGVKIQDDVSLPNKTGAGQPEEPSLLPIRIQNHGDPVRFRNVWIADRGLIDMTEFPIKTTKQQRKDAARRYRELNKQRMQLAKQQQEQRKLEAQRVLDARRKQRDEAIQKAIQEINQELGFSNDSAQSSDAKPNQTAEGTSNKPVQEASDKPVQKESKKVPEPADKSYSASENRKSDSE
ncbi:MAG: family 16 glycoside hydrolase [Planctomycetota bacterium]